MPFGCVESTGVLPGGRHKKLYQESGRTANLDVWTPPSLKMFPIMLSRRSPCQRSARPLRHFNRVFCPRLFLLLVERQLNQLVDQFSKRNSAGFP